MSLNYQTKIVTTTPYHILVTDEVIFVNVTSGPASVVLPSSGSSGIGFAWSFYIKDYSGTAQTNPITITAAGGKTIDGGSFAIINGGYAHIHVVYDSTNWKIIS